MYSDNGRSACVHRANDEFLRRMIGGEVVRGGLPEVRMDLSVRPTPPQSIPSCDGENPCEECPTHVHAPALAMVYAPMQCWRNLFDPHLALRHGTLFAELVLPLEGCKKLGEGEVRPHR